MLTDVVSSGAKNSVADVLQKRVEQTLLVAVLSLPVSGVANENLLPRRDPSGEVGKDLFQQAERLRSKQRAIPLPAIREQSQDEADLPDGPTFTLNGIRFTRSNTLTQEELASVVRPWLSRQINFGDLRRILAEINGLYRERDIYTSVAVFPEQRVEGGVVIVRLVEGSVGELLFEGNSYTEDGYLSQWIHPENHKTTVDVKALESEIQFYNRIHNRRLQAELRAGKGFGLTDIVINVPEPGRDTLNVFVDNYGYESTGEGQLSALYQREKLFRTGDRALAYALTSTGLNSLSTSYNTVIGNSGWRLGGSLQYTDTAIKKGDFSTLNISGDSLRYSLDASYLVYSGINLWVDLVGSASQTRSKNKVAGADLSDYQTTQYQLGSAVNWLGDQWQLSGRLLYSSVKSKEKILGSTRTVSLINPQTTFIYNFDSPFYLLAAIEAQFASEEAIPGAVSFSVGGPTSLRGYKPGIVSGDSGWYQQFEAHYNGLRYRNLDFDLYGFYDYGKVESLQPDQILASAGAGVTINWGEWGTLELVAANAMKDVVPNQDSGQIYARITCRCLR